MPNKLSQFWQELKRRRVIHVIVVYATAAFVIIELVNNVTEPLNLPDWTPTFAIIVLIIGFPLALIFSWIFDVTPEGVEKTKPVDEVKEGVPKILLADKKKRIYWGRVINWSITGILMIIVITYVVIRYLNFSDPVLVHKFSLHLPDMDFLGCSEAGSAVAISPDGTKLVYVAQREGTSYLFLRPMNGFEATLIPGTEGATAVFFAPDSRWVGFYSNGYLQKVSVMGGTPQIICEAKSGCGGTWCKDNTIIFSDTYKRGLFRVPVAGGTPKQLTTALKYTREGDESSHFWPHILPGGKEILYTITQGAGGNRIAGYSLETGRKWDLIEPGNHAQYIKTGHLVYTWKKDLLAVPFNLKRMEVTGQPFLICTGVKTSHYGNAHYSISSEGSLVFIPGEYMESNNSLVLVDHEGVAESLDFPAEVYQSPRFSSDGKQLLITRIEDNANLWIYGLDRGTLRRFTDKEFNSFWGIWTPDGKEIVFNSNLYGGTAMNLFRKRSDGSGHEEHLTTGNYHQLPKSWSKDGKLLLYSEGIHPETGMDINMLQTEGDTIPIPLFNSQFNESHPILSPDGRWIGYVSDESGREEVFVSSFPGLDSTTQISTVGGLEPLWALDGKAIYFRDYEGDKLMKVSFITDPELDVGEPILLFQGKYKGSVGPWGRNYDLSPDGKQFLMIKEEGVESLASQINVILNWNEDYLE
jgi:Tol biopolymer transport system component